MRHDPRSYLPELQLVIEGAFAPRRFLDLVRDFIVFEDADGGALVKNTRGEILDTLSPCTQRADDWPTWKLANSRHEY
jgi:hypothetical protein